MNERVRAAAGADEEEEDDDDTEETKYERNSVSPSRQTRKGGCGAVSVHFGCLRLTGHAEEQVVKCQICRQTSDDRRAEEVVIQYYGQEKHQNE